MDFLKSAVASAIAKGSSFPYSLGDRVDNGESIWALHNATKRVRPDPSSFQHLPASVLTTDANAFLLLAPI